MRTIVKGILEARGYQVAEADNAAACLKLCDAICPDLILLDWMMPGLAGVEVCRRLRSTGAQMPIIFLTAKDDVADRVAAAATEGGGR